MRIALAAAFILVTGACGTPKRDNGAADATAPADACVGLQCRIDNCAAQGLMPTRISGKAYAPNATLPLYNVTVYIPNVDPGTFPAGVQCDQCITTLPGEPVQYTSSAENGDWHLDNVPSGTDVPLILTVGKWRRRALIPNIVACQDNPLPAALTSLPSKATEGNEMPKIAMVTGQCDALECLVKKLGVATSEFSGETGNGHIHLFTANGATHIGNDTAHPFSTAQSLWNDVEKLKKYDITMFSCECSPNVTEKSKDAMDNLRAYADLGGRVFLEHYHNIWLTGDPADATHRTAVWPNIATCASDGYDTATDVIDQVNNPKGVSFAEWMLSVGGSSTLGNIDIQDGRQTCTAVDESKADRWVGFGASTGFPQNFQFTTPNEMPEANRCGKVVFSDMHVASGSSSSASTGFPGGCSAGDLTPQEKALAFMFFDIASCINVISKTN